MLRLLPILVSLSAFASAAPLTPDECAAAYREVRAVAVPYNPEGHIRDTGFRPHVLEAYLKVLEKYERAGVPPPIAARGRNDHAFENRWQANPPLPATLPRITASLTPIVNEHGSSRSNTFEQGGKKYVFRPIEENLRLRLAADLLAQLIDVDTTSKSYLAEVNGKLGLVSTFVPGTILPNPKHATTEMRNLIKSGKINPDSAADMAAYEFLIASTDSAFTNFSVDAEGGTRVFDHNLAFEDDVPKLSREARKWWPVGYTLPQRYTRDFLTKLRSTTPEKIRAELAPHLAEEEMAALLFRREMILMDAELRGERALR